MTETVRKKPVRGSTPVPDHIFISFNGDAKTSMAVSWRTSAEITTGYVLCHAENSSEVIRTDDEEEVFESDIDISQMHWAHLHGLKPGTRYYYTCGDDKNRSAEFSFETEPEHLDHFKFLCVSDQQSGSPFEKPDYSNFNRVMKRMLKLHPDTRFILTGGDNTDCGQHEVQWNGAFSGLTGFVESVPFMMTLGNHDNRGFQDYAKGIGRYYAEPAEFFDKQFKGSFPDNGPKDWKTENYSFDYGDAHFVVFGVNGPEDVNEWALKDIGGSDRIWKFGSYHFPIYYSGPELSNDDAYPMMRPSMEMLDILFSGHEHDFSRSFPIKNEEIFDKPSQGTVHYELGNSNANPPGTMSCDKVWHAAHYPEEEKVSAVAVVEVFPDRVELTTVLDDGRIADSCVIDKAHDEIRPYALAPIYQKTRMFYKGVDLALCQHDILPEEKDGVWCAPLSLLFSFMGGGVLKEKGKVTLSVYGHTAVFTEGSDRAKTEKGEITLPKKVYRGTRGQLYIPLDALVKGFGMKWAYAKRNNFITVEHATEEIPCTEQP